MAIGRLPHLIRQLRDGSLVAPFGQSSVVPIGSFYVIVAPRAPVDVVNEFVAWLQQEAGEIPKL